MNLFKKLFWKKITSNTNTKGIKEPSDIKLTPEQKFQLLDSKERMKAIMSLGDTGQHKFYDLLKFSIESDPDIHVRFAALKRIHLFKDHPDLMPFLKLLKEKDTVHRLEPYLSMALLHTGNISEDEFQQRINGSFSL